MANKITREQIKDMLHNKEPMTIVETLPQRYFDAEHLPGAFNIPHDDIRQKAEELLPDKSAFIVVYCASTECQNSKIATDTLKQMGYTNAFEYVEGKRHWLEENLPVESTN